jgi:hypothetical protein
VAWLSARIRRYGPGIAGTHGLQAAGDRIGSILAFRELARLSVPGLMAPPSPPYAPAIGLAVPQGESHIKWLSWEELVELKKGLGSQQDEPWQYDTHFP